MKPISWCPYCLFPVIIDEGNTIRYAWRHWRINKTTGRLTALCPICNAEVEIEPGSDPDDRKARMILTTFLKHAIVKA